MNFKWRTCREVIKFKFPKQFGCTVPRKLILSSHILFSNFAKNFQMKFSNIVHCELLHAPWNISKKWQHSIIWGPNREEQLLHRGVISFLRLRVNFYAPVLLLSLTLHVSSDPPIKIATLVRISFSCVLLTLLNTTICLHATSEWVTLSYQLKLKRACLDNYFWTIFLSACKFSCNKWKIPPPCFINPARLLDSWE